MPNSTKISGRNFERVTTLGSANHGKFVQIPQWKWQIYAQIVRSWLISTYVVWQTSVMQWSLARTIFLPRIQILPMIVWGLGGGFKFGTSHGELWIWVPQNPSPSPPPPPGFGTVHGGLIKQCGNHVENRKVTVSLQYVIRVCLHNAWYQYSCFMQHKTVLRTKADKPLIGKYQFLFYLVPA